MLRIPPPANFSKLDSFRLYWIEVSFVRKLLKWCSEVAHLYETEFPTYPPPSMRTKEEVLTAECMRES